MMIALLLFVVAPSAAPFGRAAASNVASCSIRVDAGSGTSRWSGRERCSSDFSVATPTRVTLTLTGNFLTEGYAWACIRDSDQQWCMDTTLVAGKAVGGTTSVTALLQPATYDLVASVGGQQELLVPCVRPNLMGFYGCLVGGFSPTGSEATNTANGTFTAVVARG